MCPALRQPVFASWAMGAVFVTMYSSKMATDTVVSNDAAAPQSAYSAGAERAPAENFAAAQAERMPQKRRRWQK